MPCDRPRPAGRRVAARCCRAAPSTAASVRGARPTGLRRNRASSSAVNGRSSLGTIHGGVRWKTVTSAGGLGQFGNDLHRAGSRADHRDPAARQVDARIPLRGVHHRAGEVGQAGDVGKLRFAEQSDGADTTSTPACGTASVPTIEVEVPLRPRVPADAPHPGARAAGAGRGRSRRRPTPDRPGSPAAGRRCGSSSDWARRRTNRGGSGCRRPRRGRCCAARCRRHRRRASMMTGRRCRCAATRPRRPGRRSPPR